MGVRHPRLLVLATDSGIWFIYLELAPESEHGTKK